VGCFLGLLGGVFRLFNCFLRKVRKREDGLNSLTAGMLAGGFAYSQFASRNSELSMYFASKAVQTLFEMGVNKGLIHPWKQGDTFLFSISVGLMFYAAAFEPHNLRPSYFQFLIKFGCGQFDHLDKWYKEALRENIS